MDETRSEWRSEGGFVYRLIWDGDGSMVNEFSILVQRGHSVTDDNCKALACRIAAMLNAGEEPIYS